MGGHEAQGNEGCRRGGTHESNEGDEGNEEGHEAQGNEGCRRGGTHESPQGDEGHEGNEEGHEGDESNEGHEGDEEVKCGGEKCDLSVLLVGHGHDWCLVASSHGGVPRRALLY